jgi:hypothetical protein
MVEAGATLAVSLIVFAFGYGRLIEKIKVLEADKKDSEVERSQVIVALAEIKKDIHYIKEKI